MNPKIEKKTLPYSFTELTAKVYLLTRLICAQFSFIVERAMKSDGIVTFKEAIEEYDSFQLKRVRRDHQNVFPKDLILIDEVSKLVFIDIATVKLILKKIKEIGNILNLPAKTFDEAALIIDILSFLTYHSSSNLVRHALNTERTEYSVRDILKLNPRMTVYTQYLNPLIKAGLMEHYRYGYYNDAGEKIVITVDLDKMREVLDIIKDI